MNRKNNLLKWITIICLSLTSSAFGQRDDENKQTFPLAISLTNHSWSFPFQNVFRIAPVYPGISTETAFFYRNKEHLDLCQTVQVGAFHTPSSGAGAYLNSNFLLRYTFSFGLVADVGLGLGYFNSFYPSATYTQTPSGTYEKSSRSGVGSLASNMSIGVGYDLSIRTNKRLMPFIRYQWIGSTNYWSLITIRPNGLLHVGVQFHPFN